MSGGRALPDKCSSLLQVKGHRRITFDQFISALSHIAEKKQCQLGEVATAVLSNNGPAVSGTRADYVKLFDDKSTYTGVCVVGRSMAVAEPCVCAGRAAKARMQAAGAWVRAQPFFVLLR